LDEFFQNLREIQKKERSLSSLSPVGADFYQQISSYFNRLMERIDNNPFSFESYLLRDAQRIVVEICERREYKITNSAVMNAQRSYHLFKNSREDGMPRIPSNSTPEEEKLYREIYQSLTAYKEEMRSPLVSYSHKKDIKLNSLNSLKKTSKSVEEGQVDEVKVNPVDRGITEQIGVTESFNENSISKKRRDNSVRTNPAVDEIPPEIQDEIYRQFGREPSKEDSKKSANVSSGESKPGNLKDSFNNPNNSKSEFNEDTVHSVDPVVSKVSKDTPSLHKMSTEILMILDELPSIMGVDSKVYGPFHPGDIITMPEPNARILIKNHKGKSIQRYK
jgi:DNA replication factor GINS